MKPDDFAAALSDRLRARGVVALPEDVRSFTADIGQRIADAPDLDQWATLFIQSLETSVQVTPGWGQRSCFGAIIGFLCPFMMTAVAGAVWGAINRPAPCYGGGGPDAASGAACGVMIFMLFGLPVVVALAGVGAALGAWLARKRPARNT